MYLLPGKPKSMILFAFLLLLFGSIITIQLVRGETGDAGTQGLVQTSPTFITPPPPDSPDYETIVIIGGASGNFYSADKIQPYTPRSAFVKVNTPIAWINNDSVAHSVTSGDPVTGPGEFDSGMLLPGQRFEYSFNKKGDFTYYCSLHPYMQGMVRVH